MLAMLDKLVVCLCRLCFLPGYYVKISDRLCSLRLMYIYASYVCYLFILCKLAGLIFCLCWLAMQAMLAGGYHLYTGWLAGNDGYAAWLFWYAMWLSILTGYTG